MVVECGGMDNCKQRTNALAKKLRIPDWGTDVFDGTLYQGAWTHFEGLWRLQNYPRKYGTWDLLRRQCDEGRQRTWPRNDFLRANEAVRIKIANIAAGLDGPQFSWDDQLQILTLDDLKKEYIGNLQLGDAIGQVGRYATHVGLGVGTVGLGFTFFGGWLGAPAVVGTVLTVGGYGLSVISSAAQASSDYLISDWARRINIECRRRVTDTKEWAEADYNAFMAKFAPGSDVNK